MITAKEARDTLSAETRYIWQIDQLIDKASKEGRREISFHYLNDERINTLKQNGYTIDNEKCIISW